MTNYIISIIVSIIIIINMTSINNIYITSKSNERRYLRR